MYMPSIRMLALLLMAIVPGSAAANPIYVYKESDGVVRFTTKPPPDGVKSQVFSGKSGSFAYYRMGRARAGHDRLFKSEYADIIGRAARAHDLDANLIRAVIHVESAFEARAVSPKGALGLMQLMPYNARLLKVRDPFSPSQNIPGGAKFLADLLKRYSGNLKLALAAYNAGAAAVDKHNGIPPFAETVNYVRRVLYMYKRYNAATHG